MTIENLTFGDRMKKIIALIVITILGFSACAIKEKPIIKKYSNTSKYQFVVIPSTDNLSSSSGGFYGNQYGVYGSSQSKSLNPSSVIEGILLKKGLTSVNKITPEIADKTLIVKYGESGRRDVMGGLGGYTLEVTIKFISAKTKESVFLCTAEGQGETEVDDIRDAITRCLSGF